MRIGSVVLLALVLSASAARAALDPPADTTWDGSRPPDGVYFHWYEPSFYTGFAPRTQDPHRVHIELSRGNQVRVTLTLGEQELDRYLEDLVLRRQVYQELIERNVIELTTNKAYERFGEALERHAVAETLRARASTDPAAYRKKTVEIMSALNPERIFVIHIPFDSQLVSWREHLLGADLTSLAGRLDAANAILPGRVNLYSLAPDLEDRLRRLAEIARAGDASAPAFRDGAAAFLAAATGGKYAVRDGFVDAVELTAIYPAGTIEGSVIYDGERLPTFGVSGVWSLIPRTQGRGLLGMVDYISTNPGYGFITMLPYQHAGGISYNAFHNAGVRCGLGETPFLPKQWRRAMSERDPSKPYQNLWIISRAPTSHGCTRLASGHMSELRQILPSSSEMLKQVDTFRNLAQCHDVFDLRGDGHPQVMGVQYYLAYKSNDHTPVRAYVSNRRDAYYRWLYGENIELGEVGQCRIKKAPVCRFVGVKKAEEAGVHADVPLYEARFEPEAIQFYRIEPVPFDSNPGYELNRELRKVGAGYDLDRKKLLLK